MPRRASQGCGARDRGLAFRPCGDTNGHSDSHSLCAPRDSAVRRVENDGEVPLGCPPHRDAAPLAEVPHDDRGDDGGEDGQGDGGRRVKGDGYGHADASYGTGCRKACSH